MLERSNTNFMKAYKMNPTIKDIAAEAGVSRSLVSFYLNHLDTTRVAKKTRDKIDETVKKLGYRRNENALVTRTGISRNIALIYDFSCQLAGKISAGRIICGILGAAAKYGYSLKIYNAALGEQNLDSISSYGISYIICFSFSKGYRLKLGEFCRNHNLNLCFLQESYVDGFPTVNSDNFDGMYKLTEHFIKQGHERFAFLSPQRDVNYSQERYDGFASALNSYNLRINNDFTSARKDMNDHFIDLERIFALPKEKRPSAFLCCDDTRALKVIISAMRHGIPVQEECALGGFGNTSAHEFFYPISTVDEQLEEIGIVALKTVLGQPVRQCRKENNKILLPTKLIHYQGYCLN